VQKSVGIPVTSGIFGPVTRPLEAIPPQLDLFAQNEALVEYLNELAVDSISARQALQHLYNMTNLITG
jgi:hypothetical protein